MLILINAPHTSPRQWDVGFVLKFVPGRNLEEAFLYQKSCYLSEINGKNIQFKIK